MKIFSEIKLIKNTDKIFLRCCLILLRCLLVLASASLFSACSIIYAKPVMPVEQGITFYTVEKTPAPTVLMFPGCGGTQSKGLTDILPRKAKWLNDNGFNAVLIDYIKIMGLDNACLGQIKPDILFKVLTESFHYVASQPSVDHDHIALLGWSLGASAVLTIAEKIQPGEQPNITAVAAYYPGCYPGLQLSVHPTLLLLGLADNVVNANDCLTLAGKSPQTPLIVKTYPGAHHSFDIVEFKQPKTAHFLWKEFTSAYDPLAAQDAEATLLEFLKANN